MDNILFIVPPSKSYDDFSNPKDNARIKEKNGKFYGHIVADMPIGILSLSAYIKNFVPVNTKLLDFNVIINKLESFDYNSFEELFEDFLLKEIDFNPNIIGISSLFGPSYKSILSLSKICKKIFNDSTVLAGGAIPMNMYQDIFERSDCFDALCYGEGEKPLLNYILTLPENRKDYLENSQSWITKNKLNEDIEFKYDFIENLDIVPFYDYDICNAKDYGISPAITAYSAVKKTANYHVMTSRGCPFQCTFCASHTVHGRKMRYFSVKRVKEDLTLLSKRAGLIIFQDDHFLSDKDRAKEIINFIKDLNVKVVFQNGLALKFLSRDILEALKNSGINQLVLPVESGSQRVLTELMHKSLDLDTIKRVLNDCRELGIYADVNIILGMPGETKKDFKDSLIFLRDIKANWFRIHVATPLIGSDMYKTCMENNYLKESFDDCHYKKSIIETEFLNHDDIEEMQHIMNLDLNFVNNYDLKIDDYKTALQGFENAISARPNLPFAYYYASKCYYGLGNHKKADEYFYKAEDIILNDAYWKYYAELFGLDI